LHPPRPPLDPFTLVREEEEGTRMRPSSYRERDSIYL